MAATLKEWTKTTGGDDRERGGRRRRSRSRSDAQESFTASTVRCAQAAEILLLVALLLAPWAIGAVDAWAMLALDVVILLAAILSVWARRGPDAIRRLLCLPSLALLGLSALSLLQAREWPESLLTSVDPRTSSFWNEMIPKGLETVKGDQAPPVAAPSRTLSADPEASRHQATRFFMAWLLFQAVMGLGVDTRSYKRLAVLLAINAAALTMFAIVQALNWNGKIYWVRQAPPRDAWSAGGPFVHHGHLADYLNLALGLALGLLLTRDEWGQWNWRQGSKLWMLYLCGLLMVGVAASQSRGGALAMALSGIALLILARLPLKMLIGGIGGAIVLGLIFLNALGSEATVERLRTISDRKVHEVQWRTDLWRQGYEAWTRHPALGVGLGAFQVGVAPELDQDFDYYFDHAENEFLTVLAEGGAVGMGLCLMGIGGVFWMIRQASVKASSPNRRIVVLGAAFSILSLALHNFTDFGAEIPAVALTGVVICGYVGGLALRDRRQDRGPRHSSRDDPFADADPDGDADADFEDEPSGSSSARAEGAAPPPARSGGARRGLGTWILGTCCALAAVWIIPHDWRRHRAAWEVINAELPRPATRKAVVMGNEPDAILDRYEDALTKALADRPDWYEGHMRLALTRLQRYCNVAYDELRESGLSAEAKTALAAPIWLRRALIEAQAKGEAFDLNADVPAPDQLRLAARGLLEARRCCPGYAPAHVWLGCLDFLLELEPRPAQGATVHAKRSFRAAGSDDDVIWMTAELAAMDQDDEFLADCWRRSLQVRERDWIQVADAAAARLQPDMILDRVTTQGRHALWFADHLYSAPDDPHAAEIKQRFLEAAVERLPRDRNAALAEKLFYEGLARARLGDDPDTAYRLMRQGLEQNQRAPAWRLEAVKWLLSVGKIKEAKDQAVLAYHLDPNHTASKDARDLVTQAEIADSLKSSDGAAKP